MRWSAPDFGSAGVGRLQLPVCRQKALDVAGLGRWQSGEHVRQVFQRIDAAAAAAHEDRVDDGAAPAGIRVADEEPPASSDCRRPDRVFDEIVVDFVPSVAQVSLQRFVLVDEVVHRLAERALGQHQRFQFVGRVFIVSQIAGACCRRRS